MERTFVYPTVSGLARDIHALAREKGFYDTADDLLSRIDGPLLGEISSLLIERRLGLITSEVSEALEVIRKEGLPVEDSTEQEMLLEELSDAIIRLLDLAEWVGPGRIEDAVLAKHEKNAGRPYRHGRNF